MIDLTGKRFYRWQVIKLLSYKHANNREALWECLCDCGVTKEVTGRNLRTGDSKSCGCYNLNRLSERRRIRPYESLYNIFIKAAKSRNHSVNLSYEDFLTFIVQPTCHYCNDALNWLPFNNAKAYHLDRKDNNLDYSLENCVVCCTKCNNGKGSAFSYNEWREIGKLIQAQREGHLKSQNKLIIRAEAKWDGTAYKTVLQDTVDYDGDIAWACGASQSQKDIGASQQAFYGTLQQQMSAVFGDSSTVFNDLMSTYAPIVAAGPNQEGFSATENANLKSQAITGVGTAYENARQAVGENIAAQGGGNVPGLVSGTNVGTDVNLAASAANQTSSELSQITQADYAQGRQNWLSATSGLAGATNAFNPATGMAGAANTAGENAANTANQISQQNNSWINAVTGLAGSLGGAAIGAFSGGSSTPYDANSAPVGYNVPGFDYTSGVPGLTQF
jgi:hypothetical protein